jgi:rubredoxin
MKEWECTNCGYVFAAIGEDDISHGLKAGVAFGSLSRHFTCHLCGAPKEKFKLREKRRAAPAKKAARARRARA